MTLQHPHAVYPNWRFTEVGLNLKVPITAAAGGQTADVGVGLVEQLAIAPATTKLAAVGVGLIRQSAGQVTAVKSYATGVGLVKAVALAPDVAHSAPIAVGLVEQVALAPSTAKVAAAGVGLVEVIGVAVGTAKTSAVGVGLVECLGIEPDASVGQGVAVGVGLVEVIGIAPGTAKSATAGIGLVEVVAIAPSAFPHAHVNVGLIEALGLAPDVDKTAAVRPGRVIVTGPRFPTIALAANVAAWHQNVGDYEVNPIAVTIGYGGGSGLGINPGRALWSRFTGLGTVKPSKASLVLNIDSFPSLGTVLATTVAEDADSPTMPVDVSDANSRTLFASGTDWQASTDDYRHGESIAIDVTDQVVQAFNRPGFAGTLSLISRNRAIGQSVVVHSAHAVVLSDQRPRLMLQYGIETAKSAGLGPGLVAVRGITPTVQKSAQVGVGLVVVIGIEPDADTASGMAILFHVDAIMSGIENPPFETFQFVQAAECAAANQTFDVLQFISAAGFAVPLDTFQN